MMTADVKRNELLKYIDADSIDVEKVVNPNRIYKLNSKDTFYKSFVYLMNREQRVCDNWALVFSQQLALQYKQPIIVLFFLDKTVKVNSRRLEFMMKGLEQVKADLEEKNIIFRIIFKTEQEYIHYLKSLNIGCLVTDFSPLNEQKKLNELISKSINASFYEVDSHNIVPCRYVSRKQEYSAATFRLKMKRLISDFLTEYPELKEHPYNIERPLIDEVSEFSSIEDETVKPVKWLTPSSFYAEKELDNFLETKLNFYEENRNDPTKNVLSNMSVYLHFGQISSQRIAIRVLKSDTLCKNKEAYLEEMVIRKELADNFCFYNKDYQDISSFPLWAQATLQSHKQDVRTYNYKLEDFENLKTHDNLWNSAQKELIAKGKMHSYMRMYWCKKILEWSESAAIAQEISIYLNDKYSLDGLDPNGYVGIAWSIGGVHDRAWSERSVFGKVRYMNFEGCKRKFDVELYMNLMKNAQ